jgi:DNA invertase Pin-like site-specific DNA recombinase
MELLAAGHRILHQMNQSLELELGRERHAAAREARRARRQQIGRPKALDNSNAALARRIHAGGESASTFANTLGPCRRLDASTEVSRSPVTVGRASKRAGSVFSRWRGRHRRMRVRDR